jgi:replicative DNA helicase
MNRKRDANRGGPIDYRQMTDSRVEQLRIPPQSIEAEQAVLGGLMLAPDAWTKVADRLTEADFYRRDHQMIYRAIAEMAESDPPKPYDAVTLGEWFESNGFSELVAGGAYLIELASTTPSAANIAAYAEIVRDKAVLRQLIDAGTEAVNDAFLPGGRDSAEILAAAEQRIMALSQKAVPGGLRMIGGTVRKLWDRAVDEAGSNDEPRPFTPFPALSRFFRKRMGGKVVVVAARPSVGKTALALQIALWHAKQYGEAVAVFSLEMSAEELTERAACAEVGLESGLLDSPKDMTPEEWALLDQGVRELRTLRIAIDDSTGMTMRDIRARAVRMHQKIPGGLKLIVVDYLQLVETYGAESREQGVAAVSRGLKSLAKELNVTVIALSQIGRGSEKDGREPTLADLRESGAIEQDADMVAFLHPGKHGVSVIVEKNRAGPKGRAKLSSELQFYRFTSYEEPLAPLDEPPPKPRRRYGADTAKAAAGGDR